MVKVKVVTYERATQIHKQTDPGPRLARMRRFDEYVQPLLENPNQGLEYEDLDEVPAKFIMSLRAAFARNGLPNVIVRKVRGENLIKAYIDRAAPAKQAAAPAPPPQQQKPQQKPKLQPQQQPPAGLPARRAAAPEPPQHVPTGITARRVRRAIYTPAGKKSRRTA